jgi:putative Holliday junction resolvase
MAGQPAPPSPQLILAFDFGTRRIGLASGDTLTRTARALSTLDCGRGTPWPEIDKVCADLQPSQLIVGLPLNMDGTPTPLTAAARTFASELESRYRKPVALVDERLSSREAEAQLRDARAAGLKHGRTKHADVDMIAARILLERWFAGEAEASTMRAHDS